MVLFDRVWHPGFLYKLHLLDNSVFSISTHSIIYRRPNLYCLRRRRHDIKCHTESCRCPANPISRHSILPTTQITSSEIRTQNLSLFANDTLVHHYRPRSTNCSHLITYQWTNITNINGKYINAQNWMQSNVQSSKRPKQVSRIINPK